jgi:hypothetical protein
VAGQVREAAHQGGVLPDLRFGGGQRNDRRHEERQRADAEDERQQERRRARAPAAYGLHSATRRRHGYPHGAYQGNHDRRYIPGVLC